MSYFVRDPEDLHHEAESRYILARRLKYEAQQLQYLEPSRANEIAVKAASRLVKETRAYLKEWTR